MKLNNKTFFVLISTLALAGCNNLFSKHVKCDDESATSLVTQVLQDDLAQSLEHELKALIKNGAIKDLDPTKLKLSAKNIQFALSDSRTDFIDPNSPKTSCSVDLTATIPSDLVKKSDQARAKVDVVSVEQHANNLGVNYENNKVHLTLEYVLQPTDKGDKVLALLKNTSDVQTLLSETLTYAFLKPQIEKNQIRNLEASKEAIQNNNANNATYDANYEANAAAEAATEAAYEATAAAEEAYYAE
ncbi:hypothetical protein H0920_08845 [Acinetobacter sp. C_4_1]|uniref:hypothetical protein n=1 Tax=unclassified Acinetobacter TaxID=196816 RepID=UPI0021B73CFD|nr:MULTISPECIES: hypothetical protein [unclassified Acinetobacter]MCT8089569.1 hypothetical protein [Acinetobacter sp. F_3_1]MCT8098288.1 hypothetical protein [Acinetobacter sp. C_3_1]MCT8101203.1 hypothetical protein [Acinetobacter sp. C_4_1]MCT8135191.1 hypothetical protein [Acinetobacter sp. T_3_1]